MATRFLVFMITMVGIGCTKEPSLPQWSSVHDASHQSDSDGTTQSEAVASSSTIAPTTVEKISAKHLPNPVRLTSKVISGGLPEGELAFAELQDLGVKTVISVDGTKPDVATARKYGMRYVHLPHSYDGIPKDRAKELAKAVREFPGTIYVHCHHGKHRSPAAAAVACIGAGFIDRDEGHQVLTVAGTGVNYRGLFQSVDDATRLDSSLLGELQANFPETAQLPAMAEAMVAIEHSYDHLKMIEKAGWKAPADHPALSPKHEALLLREHFTELQRTDDMNRRSLEFQQLTQDAAVAARALEETLQTQPNDPETASRAFAEISSNCKSCHQVFRDLPGATSSLDKVHPDSLGSKSPSFNQK